MFEFTKEIAQKLRELRKAAGLSQSKVAERIGQTGTSNHTYIIRLENGTIKHPTLETVLNYLDAIGVSWITFFRWLVSIKSLQEHKQVMSTAELPADGRLPQKLDRDVLLYETKIKPPQNYFTKVDMVRVKQKVKDKVTAYCKNLAIKQELILHYLDFAQEILVADKYKPILDKYNVSGVSDVYLNRIMNIVNKILRTEQKKIEKKKPIRLEKARKMAVKYLRSRVQLVVVENKISKLLEKYNLKDTVWYNHYMNFARACFGKIKKFYNKKPILLKQHLKEMIITAEKNGLQTEILAEIENQVLAYFHQ